MKRIRCIFILLLLVIIKINGKEFIYDNYGPITSSFFEKSNSIYVITNHHIFTDTLYIPKGCELLFKGGSLSGPIYFHGTKLSGDVNIKGSTIAGTIANKEFNASWLCNMDGVKDDADNINNIIRLCNRVFFPKGKYRLISKYKTNGHLPAELLSRIKTHIGINRNNLVLYGENGTEFITNEALSTICIFSQPKNIKCSVKNIRISNISFTVFNDGKNFHEFIHTIVTIGVNGLVVSDCCFHDFWGDAICLSHYGDNPSTGERTRNQNVYIFNNTIEGPSHNNRNGISIINGKNVLVKKNLIRNLSKENMPGGIDIEPNNSAYTIFNIRIDNNIFENITSNAIQIYFPKNSHGRKIYISNNKIYNTTKAFAVHIKDSTNTEDFCVEKNYVDGKTIPYSFRGGGISKKWVVKDNIFEKYTNRIIPGDITVKNLVIKNNKRTDL